MKKQISGGFHRMVHFLVRGFSHKRRIDKIGKQCGCVCFCPKCNEPLNDQADCTDTDFVRYHCNACGTDSKWTFDAAPVPLLISSNVKSEAECN